MKGSCEGWHWFFFTKMGESDEKALVLQKSSKSLSIFIEKALVFETKW